MCGVAGIMTHSGAPPERALLAEMSKALVHRGPDGEGVHFANNVGLAQRRLAIIDLKTGNQPFLLQDGTSLIANAEIYNYLELKREMTNTTFTSSSDCEVPLHLYKKHGLQFAEKLRGMYAIAIHDPTKQRLILTRDPFGIKPLYYTEGPFGFAFASEPKAFIQAGMIKPKIRQEAAEELMQLQFITGRETIISKIFRVLPGETLVVEAGKIVNRIFLPALPSGGPKKIDQVLALEKLEEALSDSTSVHQRSDVPYGMFLSGGIDSSIILTLMARLNEQAVRAFTVGFSDTDAADERPHAAAVAKALGAEHIQIDFTENDFWTTAPKVAWAMDDPVADYAELPTYKLAAVAGEELKVILCGEGGDELFGGYGRYRSAMRPRWQFRRAMRSRGALEGMNVLRNKSNTWRQGFAASETVASSTDRSSLQISQATDCIDWLPHDLLIKLDRCLMAHGVEGRTPMLDPSVVDVAFRLPDRLKIQGKHGKWILRKWLQDILPLARPFDRKRGFTVPVGEWIVRKGKKLGPLVARQSGIIELCHADTVKDLFCSVRREAGFAAWILLFYALWHRCHVERVSVEGDVFAFLGNG